ncbi:Ff.00g064470.m01.CDS01 [Fusarium sp. VM40]|nr:Ff.00g064470.m01.CDS01 [Fusarium sp. VM40]
MARLEVDRIYRDYYSGEKLVHVVEDTPLGLQISGTHGVDIGGFAIHSSGKRLVVSATVDNLNKGGATQCLQNMNIALGYPEYDGIPIP